MNGRWKICTIIALILTLAFAYVTLGLATEVRGTAGYVADETWYPSSSRNILREVFGVQPSYIDHEGGHHYTVFFHTYLGLNNDEEDFRDFIQVEFDGSVTYKYEKNPAVSVVTYRKLNYETVLKVFPEVKTIQSGFRYPDVPGIDSYLNTEHPPLVKYVLGFFMLTLGDQPVNWRIPSVIMGSLTLLIVYFVVAKLVNNEIIALLVYLFAFTDPIYRAMSSIAMLDIYVAFFIALSAWSALRRNYLLSALAIGFAASCKLTGVFSIGALFFLAVIVIRKLNIKKLIVYPFAVPLLVWFTTNLPFVIKWGLGGWIEEVLAGLKWHLTSRPPGPPVSTPWGWFINENPFPLHINPDLSASVNPVIYILTLTALILVPYLTYRIKRDYLVPGFWFGFNFLGYLALYIAGNRTLYSYYVITLSPMAYVLACALVYFIILKMSKNTLTPCALSVSELRS